MELTRDQQELLEFERRWPRHCNGKIQAVREFFDLDLVDYERRMEAVLELPAARAYDAELVRVVKQQRRALRWFLDRDYVDWR